MTVLNELFEVDSRSFSSLANLIGGTIMTLGMKALTAAIGLAFSMVANAADFSGVMGLWDFVLSETTVGSGPQATGTLLSPEDFDPSRPGLELLAVASASGCANATTFRWKETRQFLSTDGIPLVTFDLPQINATVLSCPGAVQNRSGSAFAESGGTRVYVHTRALYAPGPALGSTGTWQITVFNVDGTLLWSRDFRPAGGGDPDDTGWNIQPGRSAVGGLLHRGARRDVIRIYRLKLSDPGCPAGALNRYTFLDLLSGQPVRDIQHCVPFPILQ